VSTRVLEVAVDPPYRVHVGAGLSALLPELTAEADAVAVLADAAVAGLHGDRLEGLAAAPRLEIEGGESAKTLDRLGEVLEFLAGAGLSRRSVLVTFGGGTIGDLGGLAASLFKRGIAVVHLPTTLLAQVDASVGGKTAINLVAGKNLAGTFHQPRGVICDVEVLETLDPAEHRSGLGEVVKTALIGSDSALAALEERAGSLAAGEVEACAATVAACVEIKARVVAADPTEAGQRRVLNLGHTFAHAIEHAAGYGRVPHGVAVAVGLALALRGSARTGHLADAGLEGRVASLLATLGLPTSLAELAREYGCDLAPEALMAGFSHDKKGAVDQPEFVLLERAGAALPGIELEDALLRELLR